MRRNRLRATEAQAAPALGPALSLCLATGALAGCADSDGHAHEHTHAEGEFGVRYTLAWNDEGVSWTDDGWQTTTDLGYLVRVDRGWLVSYSIQLVPCVAATEAEASLARRALRRLGDALSPVGTAWAGHGNDSDTSIVLGAVESLSRPLEWTASTTRGEGAYCSVHYLVARADDELATQPQDAGIDRLSLVLEGAWSTDGSEWTALSVESSTGFGALVALSDVWAADSGAADSGAADSGAADSGVAGSSDLVGAGPIDVRLERRLATLFDGIDFAGTRAGAGEPASADDVARAVVRSAVSGTFTTVTPAL